MNTFSIGGIHPPQNKFTAECPIEMLPLPMTATMLLSQHIGAPATPVVAKGDRVTRGQLIARPGGFVSAAVHAPITGVVSGVETVRDAYGRSVSALIIKAGEADHLADTEARSVDLATEAEVKACRSVSEALTAEEARRIIADAGIVGLGGATFPAVVKLSVKPDAIPEVLIINGCECEPYLTCDDVLMRTFPARIVEGVEVMLKACGAARAVIAVEDNKPAAIAALRTALDPAWPVEVMPLRTKYPQGGEKQLVDAVLGRRIPSGGLPLSVGAVVQNVATAYAAYRAAFLGSPLIERIVTVAGQAMTPGNYRVALGTPLEQLPIGTINDNVKVILGGPMMGRTAANLGAPVTKGTSGVLVMTSGPRPAVEECIRCGACIDACPMGLEPYLLGVYGERQLWQQARDADVLDCIECGSCSYSCPSRRPLLDYIRMSRAALRRR